MTAPGNAAQSVSTISRAMAGLLAQRWFQTRLGLRHGSWYDAAHEPDLHHYLLHFLLIHQRAGFCRFLSHDKVPGPQRAP